MEKCKFTIIAIAVAVTIAIVMAIVTRVSQNDLFVEKMGYKVFPIAWVYLRAHAKFQLKILSLNGCYSTPLFLPKTPSENQCKNTHVQ